MTVRPVQSNNDHSNFATVLKTTAIGAGIGYASKYVVPLTPQEMYDKVFQESIKVINNQSKRLKTEYIDELKALKSRTVAQDEFIKMIDDSNSKKINIISVREKLKELGINSETAKEFKQLIERVNSYARHEAVSMIGAYEQYTKHIRPTIPFVTTGVISGLLVGISKNIIRSNQTIDT